jgi:hypothetical protein
MLLFFFSAIIKKKEMVILATMHPRKQKLTVAKGKDIYIN